MTKTIQSISRFFVVSFLLLSLVSGNFLFAAASPAKQLEKGKALYAQNKDDAAMDYFIDVLVNGSRKESDEANKYINMIHNRIGGIQNPVEVDVNFKEGEVQRLAPGEEYSLTSEEGEFNLEKQTVAGDDSQAQPFVAQEDINAIDAQEEIVYEEEPAPEEKNSSSFVDLTAPDALQARAIYSQEKLDNLIASSVEKIKGTKGVRIYFRDRRIDAIDMDWNVVFQGSKFKPEAMPLLDDIYALMALTQGAGYVILPPGSYTDDIALSGIRQAMALNSFFVHKGISSGKISYNMGLFDQEPPAKFSNLDGISIVFDWDAELPASLPQAAATTKTPLLSLAVVPVNNEIDPALGQAFAIDFSVIETVSPLDNWLFQIVQHNADGKFYTVRRVEGFSPVYHQLLWNARKGIIGPELACGKYTVALTAVDMKGQKKTLRRRLTVKCPEIKPVVEEVDEATICKKCNYKTARLWTKPGRTMSVVSQPVAEVAPAQPELVDPYASASDTYTDTAAYTEGPAGTYTDTMPMDAYTQGVPAAYTDAPAAYTDPYAAQQPAPAAMQQPAAATDNPYDMPYDEI